MLVSGTNQSDLSSGLVVSEEKMAKRKSSTLQLMRRTDAKVSRARLELLIPHRGVNLVASYGVIYKSTFSLVLNSVDFKSYIEGHSWAYPGHWESEMAALAVGLEAIRQLCVSRIDLNRLGSPVLRNPGTWTNKFLNVSLDNGDPLIAKPTGVSYSLECRGFIIISGSARISQGLLSQNVTGIVIVAKMAPK